MSRFIREENGALWFREALVEDWGAAMRVKEVLFDEESDHQNVLVMDTERFGRVMALEGIVQVADADEYIYHEMVSHTPLLARPEAERVLVVGGGDGGVLREVFRHKGVTSATLVEIDETVVDFSKKWFPNVSAGAFEDPRLTVEIADGAAFMKAPPGMYDVIIVDSTDPVGPGKVLFTQDFYEDCRAALTPGGVLITQNGLPFFQPQELRDAHQRLGAVFQHTGFYVMANSSYCGGFMALGFSTDDKAAFSPAPDALRARYASAGLSTKYYTPRLHTAAFALPAWIEDILKGA